MREPRPVTYLILALVPLLFTSNLVIGRAAVESVSPWTLAFLRWFLACLIMLPFGWTALRRHQTELRAAVWHIAILGFLAMWVCGGFLYVSLKMTTATNGSLIYATSPILVVLLEAALNRQRLPLFRVLGITAGMLGVIIIVMKGDPAALLELRFNLGDLGLTAAAVAWAVYSLVLKNEAVTRLPTQVAFLATALMGAALLLPFAGWETVASGEVPTGAGTWLSIVALAVFPSVLAFLAFQHGVKRVGPALTSMFLYALPAYGVVLAAIFLGESFHWHHAFGLALVVFGIVLATGAEWKTSSLQFARLRR